MSVEQVARDFIANMDDLNMTRSHLTPDAMSSGGMMHEPIPASEAIKIMSALKIAFPDLKFDVQDVTVKGDQATVHAKWSGTNKGPLDMPLPGMKSIPATGKKVSVKDTYIITVKGEKVSHLEVDSPPDGGILGALNQIGVKMPGMK